MYYLESGEEMKKFNVLDGVGFLLLHKYGIKTAIVTSSQNPLIQRRADVLKVDDLLMGVTDKLSAIEALCRKYGISIEDVAYIGDDYADLPVIRACGFGCVPSGVFEQIAREADHITSRTGGKGCFREMVELIVTEKNREK